LILWVKNIFLHNNILFMKKLLLAIMTAFSLTSLDAQTLIPQADELILPKYLINGSTAASRIQYVCRLRLSGLTANTTYRYVTGASNNAALTGTAPGNMFAINNTSTTAGFIVGYTSNKSVGATSVLFAGDENVSTARYAELTTDANGTYVGWFGIVPTGNAAFTLGNELYFYVQLNAGAGGTVVTQSFRTTNTIRSIGYGTTTNTNSGTALRGNSLATNETFVFGYDTIGARPVFGTWVENDGITTTHTTWYNVSGGSGVDGISGAWGTVIPNDLPKGIIRIENINNSGTNLHTLNSATGIWGTTSTVNPAGGTTPLAISSADAPLPVQFKSFTATKGNDVVNLKWATATESNNKGFEVQRSVNGAKYQTVGFVRGNGNSNVVKTYSFTDAHNTTGNICYRLKQIDFNGASEFSKVACVNVELEKTTAVVTTPNPFNGSLHIKYNSVTEGTANIQIIDMLGKSHQNTNMVVNKGENTLTLDTDALPVGIYFIRVTNGAEVTTQRIVKR
jgi:hypothetical protein